MRNRDQMVERLVRDRSYNGFRFEQQPSAGPYSFLAIKRSPDGVIREHVHVAADGSIRYSDSDRYGQLWSLGTSGGSMHDNPRWSTAYKNDLPDSAFLYVDRSCVVRKDAQGRSHPLSCRHFPYKNHLGNVSLSHVRNAISRAPQSNLPASVQRDVQQKARALLERGEGRMAANPTLREGRYRVTSDFRLRDGVYRRGENLEVRRDPRYGLQLYSAGTRTGTVIRDLSHILRHVEPEEDFRRSRGTIGTMGRNSGERHTERSVTMRSNAGKTYPVTGYELTPYGPGKFDTSLDEAIYSVSLDGFEDDYVGSSYEAPGTYAALIRDGVALARALEEGAAGESAFTDQSSLRFLREKGAAGVIMFENSDGFVQVVYYDNAKELDKDWAEAERELSIDPDE